MRDFSSRYELDLKIQLTPIEQKQIDEAMQRMLHKCPESVVANLEITSVRSDFCFHLQLQGGLRPMTAFAIGPVFEEGLSDLEMEFAIQWGQGSASWDIQSLVWAV